MDDTRAIDKATVITGITNSLWEAIVFATVYTGKPLPMRAKERIWDKMLTTLIDLATLPAEVLEEQKKFEHEFQP